MIHLYRPTKALTGVIVEPSIIAGKEIKTFITKKQVSDWAQLVAMIFGSPDIIELRKPEGLIAIRVPDKQGFVTIINNKLFLACIAQPKTSCFGMYIGNVYGAKFWNYLYQFSQGYGASTKNTQFAARIAAAAGKVMDKFKVKIELAPAMQSIAPLLEGLGEPIVWER